MKAILLGLVLVTNLVYAAPQAVPQQLLDAAYRPIEAQGTTCADREKILMRMAEEVSINTDSEFFGNPVSTTVLRGLLKRAADTKDRKLADFAMYLAAAWKMTNVRYELSPVQSVAAIAAWCEVSPVFVTTDAAFNKGLEAGEFKCVGRYDQVKSCFRESFQEFQK